MDGLDYPTYGSVLSHLASNLAKASTITGNKQLNGDALESQVERLLRRCPPLPESTLSSVTAGLRMSMIFTEPTSERMGTGGVMSLFGRVSNQESEETDDEDDDIFQDAENGLGDDGLVEFSTIITSAHAEAIASLADFLAHLAEQPNTGDVSIWVSNLSLRLAGYLSILNSSKFEQRLLWRDYSPADYVTFKIVDALLASAQHYEPVRLSAIAAVENHLSKLAQFCNSSDAGFTCSFVLPSLNGLIRGLENRKHVVTPTILLSFIRRLRAILIHDRLKNIRRSVNVVVRMDPKTADIEKPGVADRLYARRLLAKYWHKGSPLSANFVVFSILKAIFELISALVADPPMVAGHGHGQGAYLHPWEALLSKPVKPHLALDGTLKGEIKASAELGVQYLTEMQTVINEIVSKRQSLGKDLYGREGMAVGLKLATVSYTTLGELNEPFLNVVAEALGETPYTADVKVQVAALDSATIHALNFPDISPQMTRVIRRFITMPSPIFDFNVRAERDQSILDVAIKRLAQCLKSHCPLMSPRSVIISQEPENGTSVPYKEIIMSTIYSLFNILAAGTSKVINLVAADNMNEIGLEEARMGMSAHTDEQKRQVCTNAIWAVAGLVVEVNDPETTALTVSMLTQRLRYSQPAIDAIIVRALVDVAPLASYKSFIDIIKSYSYTSKQATNGEKILADATVEAQTNIIKGISSKHTYCNAYLREILTLFIEKGTAIQAAGDSGRFPMRRGSATSSTHVTQLIEDLRMLLEPLELLLSVKDFSPHVPSSKRPLPDDLVTLFRNFWFFAVLYGYVPAESTKMTHIALKTPPLISEITVNYLESDLDHNAIVRTDNPSAGLDLTFLRRQLSAYIANHAGEIRSYTLAQTVFLLSVYHIENIQAQNGHIESVSKYFLNRGLNSSSLVGCMESIADEVIAKFVDTTSQNIVNHRLDDNIIDEVREFIIGICHRQRKVHSVSLKACDKILGAFPSLLCDTRILFTYLECLGLLYESCESQLTDEYAPIYHFHSKRADVHLQLSDSYQYRNEILSKLYEKGKKWLFLALTRAPIEIRGALQRYLHEDQHEYGRVQMGRSFAIEIGKAISNSDHKLATLPRLGTWIPDISSDFLGMFSAKEQYRGQIDGITYWAAQHEGKPPESHVLREEVGPVKETFRLLTKRVLSGQSVTNKEIADILHLGAGVAIAVPGIDYELLQQIVWLPFFVFTPNAIKVATSVWTWLISDRPDFDAKIMTEVIGGWGYTVRSRKGLFSNVVDPIGPLMLPMEYSPSDKSAIRRNQKKAHFLLHPHTVLIQFLSSRFQALRYRSSEMVHLFLRLLQISFHEVDKMSKHPLAREARFSLVLLGMQILQASSMEALIEASLRSKIYRAAFSWFESRPFWTYGGNQQQLQAEMDLLVELSRLVESDQPRLANVVNSFEVVSDEIIGDRKKSEIVREHPQYRKLLLLLLENELVRLGVWSNPLNDRSRLLEFYSPIEKSMSDSGWRYGVHLAWSISAALAVYLPARFKQPIIAREVRSLILKYPFDAVHIPEAVEIILGQSRSTDLSIHQLKYLLYWAPAPPITLITYFHPVFKDDSLILQYAMRALESYPIELVFFYVPQIVQALRDDKLGYVERFILGAAKISQLFAHQIIWNMKANTFKKNSYKDDDMTDPDPMKPTIDRVMETIISSLSGDDMAFYEREFEFFNEVTSISGKLKPYIKKSKAEKKAKIDEEMSKIAVEVGVYLPSNPEGVVVDIDKKSGRPLQSHAKAPYMATFKIRKQVTFEVDEIDAMVQLDLTRLTEERRAQTKDVWQAAIFKVGDDCRQDVLALQLIAMFKNIFADVGLDVYLYPYRVTATAPGCGVIDVLPASTSRDVLGREKINSLDEYFRIHYGGEDSITFQKARLAFVQSMAAYSVVTYLLQFKDRHNGNIMVDEEGHILHIDFGFIFNLAPGGITFENAPFKLTMEMVNVMGGNQNEQSFKWFSELCVKAYLATRPHAEQIIQMVMLMLGTELPCFKGEKTLRDLRSRFQLDKTEREAAEHMIKCISFSYMNRRTVFYDEFQRLTNGIPH